MSSEEELACRGGGANGVAGGAGGPERIQLRAIINPQPQRSPPCIAPKPYYQQPPVVTAKRPYDRRLHADETDELLETPPPSYPSVTLILLYSTLKHLIGQTFIVFYLTCLQKLACCNMGSQNSFLGIIDTVTRNN